MLTCWTEKQMLKRVRYHHVYTTANRITRLGQPVFQTDGVLARPLPHMQQIILASHTELLPSHTDLLVGWKFPRRRNDVLCGAKNERRVTRTHISLQQLPTVDWSSPVSIHHEFKQHNVRDNWAATCDSQIDRSGYTWRMPIRGDRNREILAASIHRIVMSRSCLFRIRSPFIFLVTHFGHAGSVHS